MQSTEVIKGESIRETLRKCSEAISINSYGEVVREERFFCSVLFHHLLSDTENKFLKIFLEEICGVEDTHQLILDEAKIFIEYAMARDLWKRMDNVERNKYKYEFIVSWLPRLKDNFPEVPRNSEIKEFNEFLIEGRNSPEYIQSPACWSENSIEQNVNPDDAENAYRLKWAFNVKPDIVIELGNGTVLCIEAKLESPESVYHRKNTKFSLSQTKVQEFLIEEVLGFKVIPIFLRMKGSERYKGIKSILWCDVFSRISSNNPTVNAAKERIFNWKIK